MFVLESLAGERSFISIEFLHLRYLQHEKISWVHPVVDLNLELLHVRNNFVSWPIVDTLPSFQEVEFIHISKYECARLMNGRNYQLPF